MSGIKLGGSIERITDPAAGYEVAAFARRLFGEKMASPQLVGTETTSRGIRYLWAVNGGAVLSRRIFGKGKDGADLCTVHAINSTVQNWMDKHRGFV